MTHPGNRVRLTVVLLACTFLVPAGLSAQQVLRANEFFNNVAEIYSTIEDYTAEYVWRDEGGEMRGTLIYKRPDKVRIDFTTPEGMMLISNGEVLRVFIPAYNVILEQDLRQGPGDATGGGNLATAEGLSLMRRNYDMAYLEGPEPVPLEPGSDVFVTQLRLDRRQVTEGFRQLVLSIDEDGFIRRIDGTKVDWEEVHMELSNIQINQRISDQAFEEETDPSASVDDNFLYDPEG